MINSGLYIHIPFCRNKCLYCDFFSGGAKIADWNSFSQCIKNEYLARRKELNGNVSSLYIGGGTPSLMPPDLMADLLKFFKENVAWCEGEPEITIEVNPEDVNEEMAKIWKRGGVNRISMGVQSFNDPELKAVGRRHDAEDALNAYNILRKYFENISIDLMFGLPGQTLESWRITIETALSLHPQHISAYSLMLEDGTAMTVLAETGRIQLPDDVENDKMWHLLSAMLKENGYEQYEISNYALSGFESHHNSKYWRQAPYLGLGPSAHSYDGGRIRRFNPSDIKRYIQTFSMKGEEDKSFYGEEHLSDEELKEEYILTRMRTREGIDLSDFKQRFGANAIYQMLDNIIRIPNQNLINVTSSSISLSSEGIMVADSIILTLAL